MFNRRSASCLPPVQSSSYVRYELCRSRPSTRDRGSRELVRVRRQPEMAGPCPSVGESAAASHSLGVMQFVGTFLDSVEDRLVDRSGIAVRAGGCRLKRVAFGGAVVGVGPVCEGAGLLVGLLARRYRVYKHACVCAATISYIRS